MLRRVFDVAEGIVRHGEAADRGGIGRDDFVGLCKVVERLDRIPAITEDTAEITEGIGIPGITAEGLKEAIFRLIIVLHQGMGVTQGDVGIHETRIDLDTFFQRLEGLLGQADLGEAHAEIVEDIGILGILKKEDFEDVPGGVEVTMFDEGEGAGEFGHSGGLVFNDLIAFKEYCFCKQSQIHNCLFY